jgi:hypothetical protein
VTIVALIFLFAVLLYATYRYTRTAYRAVGFNDGRLYQREQSMKVLERTVAIGDCASNNASDQYIEFLSVKAHSIHVRSIDGRSVIFCRYGSSLTEAERQKNP